ncbi:MAG: chitobiase/beta-hexosaminidase C-terminal domain-containing protein, partial [Bacteroidetes bacterium]|nr:chitobiase/beta-hexosaminidase C-terminal domain-containing protein [Bacteroidota bacterium]MCL2303498.1 chitobiase/beta-hexosaminidase C-terminal domain-containing protein [Lentimicrobiaceae bacterium]
MKKNLSFVKFLQRFLGIISVIFLLTGTALGQTNPTPHNLSSSNYTFNGFANGTITVYPASMQGWKFAAEPTISNLATVVADGDQPLGASTVGNTTGGIRNDIGNGLSLLNSASNNIGAIVVAVNTTGRKEIKVTWTAKETLAQASRQSALCLQYRVGTTGNFTTVAGTTYLASEGASTTLTPPQTFTNIALPVEVEDQPVVQIRWIYFNNAGSSGSRDRIQLNDITIASTPMVAEPQVYQLVTSASQLIAGERYLLASAAGASSRALGRQNTNNRAANLITISSNKIVTFYAISPSEDVLPFELILGGTDGNWTLFDEVNDIFLGPDKGSGTGNHLKGSTGEPTWTISIHGTTSAATITCFGPEANTGNRNTIRYNSGNNPPLFSCYASGQNDVYLYQAVSGVTPQVATPTIAPNGGNFSATRSVTITTVPADATIYYTINGAAPTPSSTLYTAPFDLDVNGSYVIKAFAVKAGHDDSGVATATFHISIPAPGQCDMFEDFEAAAWAGTGYAPRNLTSGGINWRVSGIGTMNADDRFFDGRSFRFRGNTTDTLSLQNRIETLSELPEGIGSVSFAYGSYGTHSGGIINVEYSIDGGATWINEGSVIALSWAAAGNKMTNVAPFEINVPGPVRLRITKNPQAGSTSVNIDNLCITDFSDNTVATPTFNLPSGNYITTQNVTISSSTEDAIIYYTIDNSEPTESSLLYTGAIPVSATTTIKAIATKAGMDNSAVASVTYTFPIEVPNIAAFKAANTVTNSTWYKITGDVIFVYRNGRNIYVKDATGGLLIFDETAPVITTAYNNGDVISGGVIGTYTLFNGLSELIPKANTAVGIAGSPVEPIILTMADLLANFDSYESQLVKLEEVSFDAGTFGTGGGANINIYQGSDEMICRNHFATFTGFTPGETKRFNVAGFAIPFNADRQIAPRDSITDITEVKYTAEVSASPTAGGSVSGDGLYSYNEEVTITATPNAAYNFVNWTEGVTIVTTNEQYTFAITEDRIFVANFQMKTYTISASVNGSNGTIAPTGDSTVNHGATVVYTITPDTNYEIDQVLINGTNNAGAVLSGSYTFENITANHSIVASFKIKAYNISVSANPTIGGSVTGGGSYNHFSTATVVATANASHNFINWTENNVEVSTDATYAFEVTGPRTLVANFTIKTYTITVNAGANGSIMPNGQPDGFIANHGSTPMFTITPDFGYHITSIAIDGVPIVYTVNPEATASYEYTFAPVVANHTISATFALNCYTSIINAPHVTITSTPITCIPHGSDVTYTFTPDFCYNITGVTINGAPRTLDVNNQFTLTNVTAKPNIVVTTAIKVFSITATPLFGTNPWGAITPAGVVNVNCGSDFTFHFHTEPGYRV